MTSQRAREAAAEFFRDERTGLAVKFSLGKDPAPLLEMIEAVEAEALERGARAMQEAANRTIELEMLPRGKSCCWDALEHARVNVKYLDPATIAKGLTDAD